MVTGNSPYPDDDEQYAMVKVQIIRLDKECQKREEAAF
jgi:hypothetical protein